MTIWKAVFLATVLAFTVGGGVYHEGMLPSAG